MWELHGGDSAMLRRARGFFVVCVLGGLRVRVCECAHACACAGAGTAPSAARHRSSWYLWTESPCVHRGSIRMQHRSLQNTFTEELQGVVGFFSTVDPNFQVKKGCFKADLGMRKYKIKQIPETPDAAKSFAADFGWVRNLPRKLVTDVDRAWRIHLIILLFPAMHGLHGSIIISYVQFLMHIRER